MVRYMFYCRHEESSRVLKIIKIEVEGTEVKKTVLDQELGERESHGL